ncbi:MAG: alanine--tRNA ligase [Pseudomonadaceae bacterium]|nr:alanine--tRNA ligase [Pseudomonadaceae bacterium]
MTMSSGEIRSAFLSFFEERGHKVVPSGSLVPTNDPTLLFTNAGMNQFKDALLGLEDPGYQRAVSAQRCVRAGGKHNDLENVGFTARHHTLFEMLGNFSFGDYFKRETIAWAWEFSTQVLQLPVERIWVTVHHSDAEAREIWENEIGLPRERVIDLDEDNFWSMGDTGPCGPSTELFYDHGPDVAGGPPGSPDQDGDRYIEFWNLVFPQFDRQADGELVQLPRPGVDTGMGLERVAAIVQHVHSNYEIDLFRELLSHVGKLVGMTGNNEIVAVGSLRVIADHIRACSFLIADGVQPGADDRNYVLRRIIRRALRHGHKVGLDQPFFHKLVAPLVDLMGDAYPILRTQQEVITQTLLAEEERFAQTLGQGMVLLESSLAQMAGDQIPGDVVFKLYDTYGFPVDLTADIARERGLTVDQEGFQTAMSEQRERGRAASVKFSANIGQRVRIGGDVSFLGYEELETQDTVLSLFANSDSDVREVDSLAEGEEGIVVLAHTPFYAESGGQVGDTGQIRAIEGDKAIFRVVDTQKSGGQHIHVGRLSTGVLRVGDAVEAAVDTERRQQIVRNHSGTHLLHAALREVLGEHVQQKGSLVAPERLRFDFSHDKPVSQEQQRAIERLVNLQILRAQDVETRLTSFDDAVASGAMALFGEKYSDEVRVLSMGDGFSVELCGGTHVSNTGQIGLLRIVSETGIASGVRRIEAVTGEVALDLVAATEAELSRLATTLKVAPLESAAKVQALLAEQKSLQSQIDALQAKAAAKSGGDLLAGAVEVAGHRVLHAKVDGDAKAMMSTFDSLRAKDPNLIVVLGCVAADKVNLVAGVPKSLHDHFNASQLVSMVAEQVGAKGGGRPDMARAGGGTDVQALPPALESVVDWVAKQL